MEIDETRIEEMKKVLEAQRSALTSDEQKLFDSKEPLFFPQDDPRGDFFDFTDRILVDLGYDPDKFSF
jgi:hypothetical protein